MLLIHISSTFYPPPACALSPPPPCSDVAMVRTFRHRIQLKFRRLIRRGRRRLHDGSGGNDLAIRVKIRRLCHPPGRDWRRTRGFDSWPRLRGTSSSTPPPACHARRAWRRTMRRSTRRIRRRCDDGEIVDVRINGRSVLRGPSHPGGRSRGSTIVYYAHRSIDSSPGRIDVVAVVMVVAVMDDVDVGGATEEEEEDGPIIAAVHPHPRPPPSPGIR